MRPRRTTHEEREAIIARGKAGETAPQLAAAFGVSVGHAYKILRAAGKGRELRRNMDGNRRGSVLRSLRYGQSAAEVARREGLSCWTVKAIARDAGIDLAAARSDRARRRAVQCAAQRRAWLESREMSASRADAFLAAAVALECAPPWVRHPQPITQ